MGLVAAPTFLSDLVRVSDGGWVVPAAPMGLNEDGEMGLRMGSWAVRALVGGEGMGTAWGEAVSLE